MGSKVQGEGDYESARQYNDETKKFVDEHTKGGKEIKGSAAEASDKLTPEEKEALKHAKSGDEDKRDAQMLKDLEKKHQR
jgi:ABC-type nitrate/sulfonate/bicarbonate transport system substrate-binding protein